MSYFVYISTLPTIPFAVRSNSLQEDVIKNDEATDGISSSQMKEDVEEAEEGPGSSLLLGFYILTLLAFYAASIYYVALY